MVQGNINRARNTDYPAGRYSIRTNQSPPPPFSHFTGQKPFLPPNQQCQSTEGNWRIRIRENMLEFSSMVLPAPSAYHLSHLKRTRKALSQGYTNHFVIYSQFAIQVWFSANNVPFLPRVCAYNIAWNLFVQQLSFLKMFHSTVIILGRQTDRQTQTTNGW